MMYSSEGNLYYVMMEAVMEETLEPVVVYKSIGTGVIFVSPAEDFFSEIDGVRKFTLVSPDP